LRFSSASLFPLIEYTHKPRKLAGSYSASRRHQDVARCQQGQVKAQQNYAPGARMTQTPKPLHVSHGLRCVPTMQRQAKCFHAIAIAGQNGLGQRQRLLFFKRARDMRSLTQVKKEDRPAESVVPVSFFKKN
jgi:hypothetical protein